MKTKILKGTKEQFNNLLLKSLDFKTEDLPVVEDMNIWTIYLEDFAENSPEWEHLFKQGTLTEINIYYEKL